jgi:hypothetical protein
VRASQKKQSQISTIRAYIEPYDEDTRIEVSIKDGNREILAGVVDITPATWIYFEYENGDLIINNSPGLRTKWDHIIYESLRGINNG